ncbi:MAG: hypothetical protein ABI411_11355 [Tahibacter sp.]
MKSVLRHLPLMTRRMDSEIRHRLSITLKVISETQRRLAEIVHMISDIRRVLSEMRHKRSKGGGIIVDVRRRTRTKASRRRVVYKQTACGEAFSNDLDASPLAGVMARNPRRWCYGSWKPLRKITSSKSNV